ncbi:aspartate aminotransferase family protein [Aerococcaceae bacterium DSM 111022]|nr:aspartate aminotransferase family protein [Aerococcaceae bacterium DSM 111022]
MKKEEIINLGEQYFMPVFQRAPISITHGEGVYLYDADGNKYLDFLSGIAVNGLGYNHPAVVEAIAEANRTVLHISNYFYSESSVKLAQHLVEHSVFGKVFFANSGAEANEGAIKLARKWGREVKGENAVDIITMQQSFHGRTMATLTATGQDNLHQAFGPLVPGFKYVSFNDLEALTSSIDENTAAIFLELIQGEGGVIVADQDYVDDVVKLAKEQNVLIIVDEVQTGNARTGKLYAYEHYDFEPDILTTAKGMASGVPMGAVLAKEEVAEYFKPGDHGSTFGGNPLASLAALATQEIIAEPEFLNHVNEMADYLVEKLEALKEKYPVINSIRGKGLIQGLVLGGESKPVFQACMDKGLFVSATAGNVLRVLPPLIIEKEHIDEAVAILDDVFSEKE